MNHDSCGQGHRPSTTSLWHHDAHHLRMVVVYGIPWFLLVQVVKLRWISVAAKTEASTSTINNCYMLGLFTSMYFFSVSLVLGIGDFMGSGSPSSDICQRSGNTRRRSHQTESVSPAGRSVFNTGIYKKKCKFGMIWVSSVLCKPSFTHLFLKNKWVNDGVPILSYQSHYPASRQGTNIPAKWISSPLGVAFWRSSDDGLNMVKHG